MGGLRYYEDYSGRISRVLLVPCTKLHKKFYVKLLSDKEHKNRYSDKVKTNIEAYEAYDTILLSNLFDFI